MLLLKAYNCRETGICQVSDRAVCYYIGNVAMREDNNMSSKDSEKREYAYLGGGCFWCVEAVYERIAGVEAAVSGYAGGTKPNPTYQQVSAGTTGHAEVVRVEFDPEKISFDEILKIFWKSHNPTTLNRQGYDAGTQYRSIILYTDERQKQIAEDSIAENRKAFDDPIVTQVEPFKTFYEAEGYHQDYFDNNPNAAYCQAVIAPKLQKLDLESIF